MDSITLIALVLTTVLTGLSAGFFYAWSCSVMPGLAKTDDHTFINAMQTINTAMLNPAFAVRFFGPLVGLPICMILVWQSGTNAALITIFGALIAYAATFVVTMTRNQPMNLELEAAGAFAVIAHPRDTRTYFEGPWVRWNHARTIASILAHVLTIIQVASD